MLHQRPDRAQDPGAPVKDAASVTIAAWLEDWTEKGLGASDRKQATKDLYGLLRALTSSPHSGRSVRP
ncbi:MAG: hypothetical protein M3Q47_16000 [Actinomycetota bacterium]|nr:hypothetical protein [Actinomycetota bacterium]